ncbi:hypothetical protein [Streptomyces sp. NBC_00582]|uniref:hypothetical protein n=1 Tax=Streptomyces sp. NBC_00582 TaxID=2975783 RepID=UPI001063B739|nr:hypothetical protein [Streptomyces sp. NBC_00582]WUB60187.1 hypothetical protein OG852_07185 [Streptomyces sp. NBC_00582]
MEKTLRILLTEEGAEAEDIAELTGFLRAELLQLDVDDVTTVTGEETLPPGARAVDITTIGALLVSLGSSAAGLSQVMNAIREWRGRCRGTRPALRLTLDDDELEISEATTEQVSEAFDLFVRRHSPIEA